MAPTEEPTVEAPSLDRHALVASVQARNPTLRFHQAQVLVSEQSLRQARYDRWPDFQLGFGYRFRAVVPGDPSNGADMFGVTLGLTLPVWMGNKQDARIRQASQELEASKAGVEAADLAVVPQLERALDALERLNREVVLYQKEIASLSRQAFDASISDYQLSRVGLVSVLQNWQAELDVELTVARFLTEREERLAEIASLVGDQP